MPKQNTKVSAATGAQGTTATPVETVPAHPIAINIGEVIQRHLDAKDRPVAAPAPPVADEEAPALQTEEEQATGSEPSPVEDASTEVTDAPADETISSETPASDTETEAEIEDKAEDEPAPKRGMQKRIGELTAKWKQAERDKDALTERIAALEQAKATAEEAPAGAPVARPILTEVRTEKELNKLVEEKERVLEWVEEQQVQVLRQPEAVEAVLKQFKLLPADAEGTTREDMQAILLDIRHKTARALNAVPERRKFFEAQAYYNATAAKDFPWLVDKATPEWSTAQEWLRLYPQIRATPQDQHLLGILVLGAKALLAQRQQAASKTKGTAKPANPTAPRLPGPSTGSPMSGRGGKPDSSSRQLVSKIANGQATAANYFDAVFRDNAA